MKILEIFKEKFESLTQEKDGLEAKIIANAEQHEKQMSQELDKKNKEFKMYLDNSQSDLHDKHSKEMQQLKTDNESFLNLIKSDYNQKIDQLNTV